MTITRRVLTIVLAGAVGWGGATGFAVAALADVGPRGATGVAGAAGRDGTDGRNGTDGADNSTVGPRGAVGEPGEAGPQGPQGPAYQPSTRTIFSRSRTGDYSGKMTSARGGLQMTMRYRIVCDSYFPFLSMRWNGTGAGDFDYVRVDSGNVMSGTQYLNPTSDSGYFEITTQDSCSWTITVTQRY